VKGVHVDSGASIDECAAIPVIDRRRAVSVADVAFADENRAHIVGARAKGVTGRGQEGGTDGEVKLAGIDGDPATLPVV
jgi:hypothetical protein